MAAIDIPFVGERFVGEKPQIVKIAKVTAGSASTNDVVLSAQEASALFNIPANTLVLDVYANVNTAFTALVTLDIGDGTDPAGWLATAKIAPQSAVSSGLVKRSSKATAEAYAGGKLYGSADTIDITVGAADVAAGQIDVYIEYIDNVDSL